MILRVTKSEDPFARVPKAMLDDRRLSWRAKGILAYLLGKPNDWVVNVSDVLHHASEGRDAIRTAFGELRDCGYAFMVNTAAGREWHVADKPRPCPENPPMGEPCPEKPHMGLAMLAKSNTTKNDKSTDTKNEEKGKARPPSEEAVVAFCKSIGLPVADAEYYWSHWQGNGFKNNKQAIKDWQAVIRSHKSAGYCPSQKNGKGGSTYTKPKERAPTGAAYRPVYQAEEDEFRRDMEWVAEQNKKKETK